MVLDIWLRIIQITFLASILSEKYDEMPTNEVIVKISYTNVLEKEFLKMII